MNKLILDKQAIGFAKLSTQGIMLLVLAALIPGTLAYALLISPIVLVNILVAVICAIAFEFWAVRLRNGEGIVAIQDGSIAVAAALLALAIPPALPFWQIIVGVIIMVFLGKHVFGGLGHNPFNPAMVAYAALMISFPQNMTLWFAPGELQSLGIKELISIKLGGGLAQASPNTLWDGLTQATPLEHVRSLRLQSQTIIEQDVRTRTVESGWLWINFGFLLGGLFLLYKNIIQWHIPVSVLASFACLSIIFSEQSLPLHYSLFSGALMLGAFFIATDPVSTASSTRGRLIFGMGVGSLTFIIRQYGGYPEGIAFAILIMNICVPLIDHLDTRIK